MKKNTKIVLVILIPLALTIATATYFNKETYVADPIIVIEKTNEQKLTDYLRDTMIHQKEARKTRERAENALIEAVSLEEHWNEEVNKALENIKMYQGI